MAVTRADKEQDLQDLSSAFQSADTAILVDYRGLNVPQVTELRRQIRAVHAQYRVVKAFWDHYFPLEVEPVGPGPDSGERAAQVAGSYGATRACSTTFCKAAGIFSSTTVRAEPSGEISIVLPLWGLRRYAEIEPWVFRQQDGDDVLVFHRNQAGQVDVLFGKNTVAEAYLRLPWYLTNKFSIGLMATSVLVFLSAVLGWPVLLLFGRGSKTRPAAWARWLAGMMALVFLACMVTMGLGLSNLNEVVFSIPPLVQLSLRLGWVAAIASIAVVVAAVLAWRGNYWTIWGRLHYSLVTLVAVAMVWFMSYWKLL